MQNLTGRPQTIKRVNLDVVLRTIGASPDISQPEIAAQTGLSLQTVNKAVRELEQAKAIICTGASEFTGGRRAKVYKVNLDREYIACIYIQGDYFYGRVTNLGEETVQSCRRKRDPGRDWTQNLLDSLEELVGSLEVHIVGVAVPGTVTGDIIYNIPAVPEWEGVNLVPILAVRYGCQILIENDMRAAAIWAFMANSAATATTNMAYISLLDHIGSAFITNGALLESSNRFAGEISYMALNEWGKTEDQTGCADQLLRSTLERQDKEGLIALVSKLMVNVCCVIAPEMVVLVTPHLAPADIGAVRAGVARYIQQDYIPELVISQDIPENNLGGMVTICRNRLEATVQVVRR